MNKEDLLTIAALAAGVSTIATIISAGRKASADIESDMISTARAEDKEVQEKVLRNLRTDLRNAKNNQRLFSAIEDRLSK